MVAEKRNYIRFLAEPNTHTEFGSSLKKIGRIRSISMGALASEYFSGTEDLNRRDSTVKIGIFS